MTLTNSHLVLKGTTPKITIGDGGEEDTALIFDGNAQDFYIGLDDSADDLIIGKGSTVGTTPAISIDEDLNVSLSAGNLVIGTSGKGIDFSITADGSGTVSSELLDEYEEGTFTPVYTSTGLSVTHDNQTGLYTKIGDTVIFFIALGTDAVSGTGSSILQITGLPFSCLNNATSFASGAVGLAYTFASNEQNMKWFIGANTSLIALYDGDSNVGGVFPSSKMGTTANDNRLFINGMYKTAS